jgi:hypothetical protein
MKTAIYVEDGLVQLVITPESEFEKNALSTMNNKPLDAKIFSGSFYDCRGGWVRQSNHYPSRTIYGNDWESKDNSLIIKVDETPDINREE